MSTPLSRAKNSKKTSELNDSGGGEREGDKGPKAFCPGWRHQPGQKGGLLSRLVAPTGTKGLRSLLSRLEPPIGMKCPPFIPVGASNRDKTPWPPLSPSLSPRPSHSAHLFLLFLARERGVLAHFFTTFVKIFDSPVHSSALKVWGLFFSSSIACVAHFIL